MMGGGRRRSQHTTVQQHAAEGIAVKYDLVFIFRAFFLSIGNKGKQQEKRHTRSNIRLRVRRSYIFKFQGVS
jgi:hypothetical protein